MRLVSMLLPTLVSASLMLAQVPIGLGPGTSSQGVIDSFDWYTATASGCTAGAPGDVRRRFPGGRHHPFHRLVCQRKYVAHNDWTTRCRHAQ